MTQAVVGGTTVPELMAELAALEDPRIREVNARHGDDHGVNLTQLRAVAKRLKIQQDLAVELWATGLPGGDDRGRRGRRQSGWCAVRSVDGSTPHVRPGPGCGRARPDSGIQRTGACDAPWPS